MEPSIFTQISLVIAVAAGVAFLMRLLKQPLIMGYIIAGIIVGPSALGMIQGEEAKLAFETFAEIGIALLLFVIGLGLNASVMKSFGKTSLLTAMAVLLTVGAVGQVVALLLGFDMMTSIFIGLALFFSSTVIILKALSDKHELGRLYGQLAIGVILIDDVVAILALVAVAMLAQGDFSLGAFGDLGLKALALGVGLYISGVHIIPRIGKLLASNSELLFLFSIAWGLSIASLFYELGLSHELGALFAGISLAGLPYANEMAAKLKPLRDFFIVLFFISLGELFTFDKFVDALLPAHILALVVMVGKPLVIMATLGATRHTKLTSFKAAVHLSQISEFSIILIIAAAGSGVINESSVAVVTMVALITIGLSTYLMKYDDELFRIFSKYLSVFERERITESTKPKKPHPAVLLGYHRGGHEFVEAFREMKLNYLVIDDNPSTIEHLAAQGIHHEYGDATDEELLTELGVANAELVVSTIDML